MTDLFYIYVPNDTKHADINNTLTEALESFVKAFGIRETYVVYVHPETYSKLLLPESMKNVKIETAKFGTTAGVKIFVGEIDQEEETLSGRFLLSEHRN